jgi:hypothetical protein
MRRQASVAVLCSDLATSREVASKLTAASPTTISLVEREGSSDSSVVTNTLYLSADPTTYQPNDLGAYIAWGANTFVLVFNSTQGLDAETIHNAQVAMSHHPMLIVITDLDSHQSSFDESLAVCQRVFGEDRRVAAISLPVLNDHEQVQGHMNLATEKITWITHHDTSEDYDLETEHYDLIGNRISELLDALAITSLDEKFVADILSSNGVDANCIYDQILDSCRRLEFIPVLVLQGKVGIKHISDIATELGSSTPESWTPVMHHWLNEPVATVLADDLIRLWQGSLHASLYSFDGIEGALTHIQSVSGVNENEVTGNVIFKATTQPSVTPGTTISESGITIKPPENGF